MNESGDSVGYIEMKRFEGRVSYLLQLIKLNV